MIAGVPEVVMVTGGVVALQFPELVIVQVYVPAVWTTILCVVAPLLHKYEFPAVEVRITLSSGHKFVFPVKVIIGFGVLNATVIIDEKAKQN
jgi:hypothetical protein